MFGSNFAPSGWALCNGQTMSIVENTALFSILGTTYGGNGVTTFNLPNLQGSTPLHMGTGSGPAAGVTTILGQTGGTTTVTLNQNNLPSHSHPFNVSVGEPTSGAPTGALLATPLRNGPPLFASGTPVPGLSSQSIGVSGPQQPFLRTQPYLAVTFIIALNGIFPSRD
jgi:microcystin-dependent protein